ncbi:hypothetical protein AAKU64_004005 [Undibacterium sp. GrIS 1.8]
MYFKSLSKASQCRNEASRCFQNERRELALRWVNVGKGFVRSAAQCRIVFFENGDVPLP